MQGLNAKLLYSQSLLFSFIKPQKPKGIRKQEKLENFHTAQVDTNVKHGLFLFEQLAYLHTENTQTKLQTLRPMNTLWKIITCLLCYGIFKESLIIGYSNAFFFFFFLFLVQNLKIT